MQKSISVWKFTGSDSGSGEPVTFDEPISSLDQATRLLPDGGYTTFRTYGKTRVLRFQSHLERLEESAHLAGFSIKINLEPLVRMLRTVLAESDSENNRVRISIDLTKDVGTLYLMVEPLNAPSAIDYQVGVKVVTRQMHRDNPKAKLTAFITTADSIRRKMPEGINETVMIDDSGRVLEGLSSNFFGVKDGAIWTAEEGVLSGITRTLALEVIGEKGLPLRLEGIPYQDLNTLDEAFITSASRGVLPVVEIDGHRVGEGRPGPLTRLVLAGYTESIERDLEPL